LWTPNTELVGTGQVLQQIVFSVNNLQPGETRRVTIPITMMPEVIFFDR
jgi:hypothetical protein